MPENPYLDYFDGHEEELYLGLLGNMGSRTFQDYWRRQYERTMRNYKGQLGRQAIAGQEPSGTFYSYLTQQSPFQQQWAQLAPWERGQRSIPSLRWLLPW